MLLIYIIIAIGIVYGILLLYYNRAWRSVPTFTAQAPVPAVRFSVIIPARNEAENIESLLRALEQQDYPRDLVEIIVVDDHSDDGTAAVVRKFASVKLIGLTDDRINSYKKKAIETGIGAASNEWIVTTDADCIPPAGWLATLASFIREKDPVFIAAPVSINCNSSLLQVFQAMDFMVLQGITGAVVHREQMSMCNGANIAYRKSVFREVNGFSGIDHIASGDDMLLMYKIGRQYPGKVVYLKSANAVVSTGAETSWRSFFNQRIRWASKAAKYQDKRILPVLLLVYLFNLSFLILAVLGFWNSNAFIWLLGLWVAKTLVELPLFISVSSFFNKQWALRWFFFFQPLHIVYTIISGFFSQWGKYEWKGRKVK